MTEIELADLCAKLRANDILVAHGIQSGRYFNPDGPEAADKLEALSGRIATTREALEFAEERLGLISATAYAGPAKRYGDHAREALAIVQAALAQTQSEG